MRTFIRLNFITMFLFITVLSAPAALDPNLILYFSFDEQLDGRKVADLTGGGNDGKLRLGATLTNEPAGGLQRGRCFKNFGKHQPAIPRRTL